MNEFLNYLGEPLQPKKIKNVLTGRIYIRDCDFKSCETNELCMFSIDECNGGFDNEWCGGSLMRLKRCAITV